MRNYPPIGDKTMFRFVKKMIRRRREACFLWQKITRGWTDKETWSLDYSLAQYIAPRLKRFKELNNGFPYGLSSEEWDGILDKMIFAFEFLGSEERWDNNNKDEWKDVQEGIDLFAKYYFDLWW